MAEDRSIGVPIRSDPGTSLFAITPNDSTVFATVTRAIWSGAGGSIAVLAMDDTASVVLANVPAGVFLPLRVTKVLATGTTATGIIGVA